MTTLRLRDFLKTGEACHYASCYLTDTRPLHMHRHDFLELFWVARGRGVHWINDNQRELRPGMLLLIRADDEHAFTSDDGKLEIVNIAFSVATWRHLCRRYFADRADVFGPSPVESREFELADLQLTELQQAALELRAGDRSRAGIERFLLNLCYILQSADRLESHPHIPGWLAQACRAMAEPANFNRGTRHFARLAGRSPEHLSRAIQKHLGKTPTDVLNESRMNHAAQRLVTGDDSILDIVLDCGFHNVSHFYKLFRARFGISPRRYRMKQSQIVGSV